MQISDRATSHYPSLHMALKSSSFKVTAHLDKQSYSPCENEATGRSAEMTSVFYSAALMCSCGNACCAVSNANYFLSLCVCKYEQKCILLLNTT